MNYSYLCAVATKLPKLQNELADLLSCEEVRRAPAWQASNENTPTPQPIYATASPGRTTTAIALV
jgi:hypothetical protein